MSVDGPICNRCDADTARFEDMDAFTDHIQEEHDAFSKAAYNHLANKEAYGRNPHA